MLLNSVFLKKELLVRQPVNINHFKSRVQMPHKYNKLSGLRNRTNEVGIDGSSF